MHLLPRIRSAIARNLRLRVLLLLLAAFMIVAVPAVGAFHWVVNTTILSLGTLFAEKQILYDRSRGLEALMREVALAETLARSPVVLEWARDEESPARRNRGIAELEHYRMAFRDKSYFFVVKASGNYYFNDKTGGYLNDQLRYTLSPDNPRDGWFYRTVDSGPGCKLNVDHDDNLAVTKVWINCVVQEGSEVLGILGTGIDLSMFIRNVVNTEQVGVESMFVDINGAIQANRDARKIDFHSLTKAIGSKKTIFQMLDSDADRQSMAAMMETVSADTSKVEADFMTVGGIRVLVGVGYLDRLGWFNVTLMDVDQIIDRRLFLPIGLLLAAVMLGVAIVMSYAFKRLVLDRLATVGQLVDEVENSRPVDMEADDRPDEIGKLSRALLSMARSVEDNRVTLEAAVLERTEQLRRIVNLDPLTGVLNRRGFQDLFETGRSASSKTGHGLILIDLDHFKQINDTRGHQSGDEVIMEVARRIGEAAPLPARCIRWGGDEFVVFIPHCDMDELRRIGTGILSAMRERPIEMSQDRPAYVTVSIGAHLADHAESLDAATEKVDRALYEAKRAGRNRLSIFKAPSGMDGSKVA